jgi:hypothetical protein
MNAKQYLDYGTRAEVSKITEGYKQWEQGNGKTVDWADEVFEPTWNSRHTIGFQGGNDRGSYYLALNHVKTNGIFVGNKDTYRRLSAQINGDYKIKKWLTVGTNNSIEKWETKSISQQSDNGSALLAAITSDPFFGPLCDDESQLTAKQQAASLTPGILIATKQNRSQQFSLTRKDNTTAYPRFRASLSLPTPSSNVIVQMERITASTSEVQPT